MKLRTQIFSGYAVLALLVVAVGVTGYVGLRTVALDFDVAINQTQPILRALHNIRMQATQLALSIAAHEPGGDFAGESVGEKADEGDPEQETQRARAQLLAANDEYRSLVARYFAGEAETAGQVADRTAQFLETVDAISRISPRRHQDFDHAILRMTGALDALQETVQDAAGNEENEFVEQQQNIERESRHHLFAILGASLLSLAAAVVGGAILTARISRPILALQQAASSLGRGQLTTRVQVTSNNEIGVLQRTFNSMGDDLARSLVSRDYVESIIESMAEGVIVVNAAGRVERCNSAMRRLYDERAMGPLHGRTLSEVFAAETDLSVPGGRQGFECRMQGRQDPPRIVAVSVSPIGLGGGAKGRVLLVQDITERKRHEERLSYLASYDVLTGLPNRRMFLDHLRATLARLPWNKQHVGLLFCDLDRFKFVNDSLGHGVGDMLLQRITEHIRDVLRPGDVVGRWAGDEFVVLLDEIANPEDIDLVAAKLVERLRQPLQIGPHELHVTLSVGTTCAPQDGLDADELVKNADMAMYAAKSAGKNDFCRYVPEMRSRTELRLMLENALRSAIAEDDQLQVHYQAQQNLDGTLIGFEALVRWQHPQLGLISPAQFLPAAEEAGLMGAIDESVLRMACAQLRRWQDAGWTDLRVAVNLSNQSFQHDELVSIVARTIDAAGVPRSAVELELTEDIVMENLGSAMDTMERLCALGVNLSIDDFGTGYSSLGQLKRCPITLLKIDRSFIMDVTHDESDCAITNAIIALAHKLGIKVLAEGVETQAQLDMLRTWGCDAIQGYLLSKPLAADVATEWLRGHGKHQAAAPAGASA